MLSLFKRHKSLTFLVSLLLLILFFPFFEGSRIKFIIFVLLYTSTLLSGIYAISYDARYMAIGLLLAAPIIICQWSNIILNSPELEILSRICSVFFLVYAIAALLKRVLTVPRAGLDEIFGAICVYVMIGTLFGLFYRLIETAAPGSFRAVSEQELHKSGTFIYFSFTTLSTAGFGDIVAVAPFARSLVIIEIITGVAYVAVLIGRLVSFSRMSGKTTRELEAAEQRRNEKMLREFSREDAPLQKRPVGLIVACVLINFVASVLMIHLHLPFFLDSWGTSLAVLLGGWWAGAITAVLYNLLIAATYWGWSSWVWMFNSLLVAGATWFFCRLRWTSVYRPFRLLAAGILTGFVNALCTQLVIWAAHLPPYEGTLRVYSFFLRLSGNSTVSALAEKLFVEVADKTLSILIASVAVFLIYDLMDIYRKQLSSKA